MTIVSSVNQLRTVFVLLKNSRVKGLCSTRTSLVLKFKMENDTIASEFILIIIVTKPVKNKVYLLNRPVSLIDYFFTYLCCIRQADIMYVLI